MCDVTGQSLTIIVSVRRSFLRRLVATALFRAARSVAFHLHGAEARQTSGACEDRDEGQCEADADQIAKHACC